ncbi:MAG: phosphoribosylamine--glycine ligase [Gammaproteobacteria bacterium]|nr:MAG: phosphoribosylamine--glycine ligase [Gammaproteobacteria bacterium]
MKVLVVGGGGREHALAWKAAQSPLVSEVLVAPGNAGTLTEPKTRNVPVSSSDLDGLLDLAESESIALTIVGPEQPLVAGIVDRFEAAGLKCFGPRAAAARLEGSKAFTKAFLSRHNIPTADYQTFEQVDPALDYIRSRGAPIVIKADGLAAGKGVIIAANTQEAENAVRDMLEQNAFGEAGATVVIEEFLRGEEASFIAIVDGTEILPLATSQDHKTRDEDDKGPNTGGMGAYSPAPVITPEVQRRIMEQIMIPTVNGMAAESAAYRGFLYAGLMIDADEQPKVIEFNCRFGDPETQPVLVRLRSDIVELCLRACDGSLSRTELAWDPRASLGIVIASRGYPGSYETGAVIHGLDQDFGPNIKVFHAGTKLQGGETLTSGGRVLCTVALATSVSEAHELAYNAVAKIGWDGAFYRRDIGYRAIARERANVS